MDLLSTAIAGELKVDAFVHIFPLTAPGYVDGSAGPGTEDRSNSKLGRVNGGADKKKDT